MEIEKKKNLGKRRRRKERRRGRERRDGEDKREGWELALESLQCLQADLSRWVCARLLQADCKLMVWRKLEAVVGKDERFSVDGS